MEPDFGGYATKAGLKCSDGRTITPEAFKHMDGQQIPLVWQHQHSSPENVLGYASLKHRKDGMYAQCFFNDTKSAEAAKALVEHGDVDSLSIYATQLVEKNKTVLHGTLNEVSLVLSGANPGAKIDYVRIAHGQGADMEIEILPDEAIITSGDKLEHATANTKTYQDVFDTLNEEQRALLDVMLAQALGSAQQSTEGGEKTEVESNDKKDDNAESSEETDTDKTESDDKGSDLEHSEKDGKMTRNVFENNKPGGAVGDVQRGGTLAHSLTGDQLNELKHSVFADLKKGGTFKEAVLAHVGEYGITNIEVLFPDAQTIDNKPEWITRRMEWVQTVIGGTNKLPFSRIKSMHADLTQDEARAKGYIKTKLKKEQFFAITSRTTTPKTIYKKQKLDRDDIVDITDFDVVAWIWAEMRFMLLEEIARAILVSDGREVDDDDKIDEANIRPIAYDDTFYTDVVNVPANVSGQDMIEAILRARQYYKGSAPTAYMTTSVMMDMLLAKDSLGRRYNNSKAELASALAVQDIVEVPVMENVSRDGAAILMILVNLKDYSVGSTRGGEVTTFDDFDIDYNQYKYLIEGRMSGALTKAKTAQVLVRGSGTLATPTVPTFVTSTGVATIPTVTGVTYKNKVTDATLSSGAQTAIAAGASISIMAVPNTGYYFPHNFDADWTFTRDA